VARTFGTGLRLTTSTLPLSAYPGSIHCLIRNTTSQTSRYAFCLAGAGGTGGLSIRTNSSTLTFRAGSVNASAMAYSLNVWNSVGGSAAGTAAGDGIGYLNGTAGTPFTPGAFSTPAGVGIGDLPGGGNSFAGEVAETALWNAVLSADDFVALANGISPLLIQPESLVFYAPVQGRYSPEIEVVGGLSLTLTGTPAYADHPRVFRPRGRVSVFVPAAGGGGGNRRRRVILCGGR